MAESTIALRRVDRPISHLLKFLAEILKSPSSAFLNNLLMAKRAVGKSLPPSQYSGRLLWTPMGSLHYFDLANGLLALFWRSVRWRVTIASLYNPVAKRLTTRLLGPLCLSRSGH